MNRTAGRGRKSETFWGKTKHTVQAHDAPAERAMTGGVAKSNVNSGVAIDTYNRKNKKVDNGDINWKVVGG
jgi:hypothetical protein